MKILLSYSLRHYDPDKAPKEQEFWGSSASVLAHSLYEILSDLGDVTYIDATDFSSVQGQSFDLFVGIIQNFSAILSACTIKKSVLFAVNMHPSVRNRTLREFVRREKLPQEAFCDWDIADESTGLAAIQRADLILAVGNNAVYNSYVELGVAPSKIKMINYGVRDVDPGKPVKRTQNRHRYLYMASEIGLRKGFDITMALALSARNVEGFHLDLVGLPTNGWYKAKIDELTSKLGDKVSFHGWVPASSARYRELIAANDFLIFPALEEGQAGTVNEALSSGLIPLLTAASGLDFAPLGWLEPTINSELNHQMFAGTLQLTGKQVALLSRQSQQYYDTYHADFLTPLRETLHEVVASGQLYPKISVTLAIFNKERTIERLLVKLDAALRLYGNAELHVIFDGCHDKTEAVVRRRMQSAAYDVTYEVTPNIFEIKTNNIGLRKSTGKYCVILQDDNIIYEPGSFIEAITFLEKNKQAAILGGLAGVNYYPRGTKGLKGSGQIADNNNEVYWRQDAVTNPDYAHRIYEVDACMRGPLFIRKDFLEKHGYLDEAYVPLYQDDMDIAFRARKFGYKVFCILLNVANESLTVAAYSPEKAKFFDEIMKRNTDIFYKRWTPTADKSQYEWVQRIPMVPVRTGVNMLAVQVVVSMYTGKLKNGVKHPRRAVKSVLRKVGITNAK